MACCVPCCAVWPGLPGAWIKIRIGIPEDCSGAADGEKHRGGHVPGDVTHSRYSRHVPDDVHNKVDNVDNVETCPKRTYTVDT